MKWPKGKRGAPYKKENSCERRTCRYVIHETGGVLKHAYIENKGYTDGAESGKFS